MLKKIVLASILFVWEVKASTQLKQLVRSLFGLSKRDKSIKTAAPAADKGSLLSQIQQFKKGKLKKVTEKTEQEELKELAQKAITEIENRLKNINFFADLKKLTDSEVKLVQQKVAENKDKELKKIQFESKFKLVEDALKAIQIFGTEVVDKFKQVLKEPLGKAETAKTTQFLGLMNDLIKSKKLKEFENISDLEVVAWSPEVKNLLLNVVNIIAEARNVLSITNVNAQTAVSMIEITQKLLQAKEDLVKVVSLMTPLLKSPVAKNQINIMLGAKGSFGGYSVSQIYLINEPVMNLLKTIDEYQQKLSKRIAEFKKAAPEINKEVYKILSERLLDEYMFSNYSQQNELYYTNMLDYFVSMITQPEIIKTKIAAIKKIRDQYLIEFSKLANLFKNSDYVKNTDMQLNAYKDLKKNPTTPSDALDIALFKLKRAIAQEKETQSLLRTKLNELRVQITKAITSQVGIPYAVREKWKEHLRILFDNLAKTYDSKARDQLFATVIPLKDVTKIVSAIKLPTGPTVPKASPVPTGPLETWETD